MDYPLLKLLHVIGAVLMGAGLIGVWLSDLRGRQLRDLARFSEAVRNIGVFYDGLVFPGAILLLISGTWMIVTTYGGWSFHFLKIPWLAGMVVLFVFEFIEGNSVTRVYFVRLRRLTQQALEEGRFTQALVEARESTTPNLTHFLDIPLYFVIVALGTTKPMTWTLFYSASAIAIVIAVALTLAMPRLYRWQPGEGRDIS
jgi:uncharacterized membrane protein